MVRWVLACAAMLIVCGCGGGQRERVKKPTGPQLTAKISRALDATLREQVASTGVPGASAAIVFPDGRQWRGAAGEAVVKPKRAMTPETSFPLDSITKVATAALAMRVVERGRLRLDDPILRWYPSWRGDARATVRDLLGHTAGTRDPEFELGPKNRLPSERRLLAAAPKPGPRSVEAEYSDLGFEIVGRILVRAADEPLATAMRRDVFGHPGGEGLAFQPAEHPRPPRAHSYWYPHGGGTPLDASDGGPVLPNRSVAATFATAHSLAGDVPSLARWGHELFGGRVLRRGSLREMARFHSGGLWEAYGLGLARDSFEGRTMWGHSGDGLGSHTEFWHLPQERLTIAVSWNDDLLDRRGGIHVPLLSAALGSS